jgi:hypothetical protein
VELESKTRVALLCDALAGILLPAERRANATSFHQGEALRGSEQFSVGDRPISGLVLETV